MPAVQKSVIDDDAVYGEVSVCEEKCWELGKADYAVVNESEYGRCFSGFVKTYNSLPDGVWRRSGRRSAGSTFGNAATCKGPYRRCADSKSKGVLA